MRKLWLAVVVFVVVTGLAGFFYMRSASAHCDTMAGPVVMTAQAALDAGDVAPVLKWVKADHEAEIREAFQQTLAVRKLGPQAKSLADNYFFETLVRVHRAGEGAPYTGLQPAGSIEPIVAASDKALETGSSGELVKHMTDAVAKGVRERFNRAYEAKKHANESVAAGREFVEAYVEYTHYVERLHIDATGHADAHGESKAPAVEQHGHQ